MYDLTILSIARNSTGYLDRYFKQVNSAFAHFDRCHLIVTEGDSDDGTKERLKQITEDDTIRGDVTIVTQDQGNPLMGHADHPRRWAALENAWNENISHLEPTRYAVCVESDLIWEWPVLEKMIAHLEAGRADVVAPLLMRETPTAGKYFFDVNAMRKGDKHFENFPPYFPEWDSTKQLMDMDTLGGMLVMRGDLLSKSIWKEKCVLHYPAGTHVVADTWAEILHP